MRLTRLRLTRFRNYATLDFQPGARICVIFGANGSGKTNLLEAISLLVPGRGLRGARFADLARRDAAAPAASPSGWGVHATLRRANADTGATGDTVEIATGSAPDAADRRVFRLNGTPPRSQAEIAAHLSVVWLTPAMERLFQEPAAGRRRFLDRLVFALEPGHAREIAAHDAAQGARNRLLAEAGARADPSWLAGLEDAIARHAVAASVARRGLIAALNGAPALGDGAFPRAQLALDCAISTALETQPAIAVEDDLRRALAAGRARDAAAGTALLGAQRADLAMADAASATPARLCSTGQQKALLIGVILAHAGLIAARRGQAPLLLLDEPAVHLDPARRAALFAALAAGDAQVLLTGTDGEIFRPLAAIARGFVLEQGQAQAADLG
ncbi:MAG: DNA replication/repair protein RecF [Rhodospirillales bacterium]|nr:DNA replication/repair protein RecF [Rhodospirillales bacterium]